MVRSYVISGTGKNRRFTKILTKILFKGDYPQTRTIDSKHLPALIHSIFFLVNILGLCLIIGLSTKKLGFTMFLYEKNFEMLSIIWYNVIKCFDEIKLLFKILMQKYIILIKNVYL